MTLVFYNVIDLPKSTSEHKPNITLITQLIYSVHPFSFYSIEEMLASLSPVYTTLNPDYQFTVYSQLMIYLY